MVEDLISVVIPVYNVENYLARCVDSVINQTYKNLQIILVDDGSFDSSSKICDEYVDIDSRVEVFHKKNGGLSDARNYGIKMAKGKYITFIDSDDWVDDDYIEYLYYLVCRFNTSVSFCMHRFVSEDSSVINVCGSSKKITKIDAFKEILYGKNFEVSACSKLYLLDLFKNIEFPVDKLFEDNATIYKLVDLNEYVAVGYCTKYNYFIRNGSITNSSVFNDKYLYLLDAVDEMCSYLSRYDDLKKAIIRKKFWSRISTLNRMIDSNYSNNDSYNKVLNDALSYSSILFDFSSSFRDRISFLLLRCNVNVYSLAWKFYKKIKKG